MNTNIIVQPTVERPLIIQAVYAATGCNYTSFFTGLSKSYFLKVLHQHAMFIASTETIPGSLIDIRNVESSTLAFIRLVGTAYFMKHRGAFCEATPSAQLIAHSLLL